ncbi:M20/M25/M40 family metallo-hydrolase [Henriciella sp. AS95]|uniref:M20/M25/M40 family metallo-hydrolase n=1 Tax=Henriciella sp. AS95 TaxID=3135782 RepID=UPI003174F995
MKYVLSALGLCLVGCSSASVEPAPSTVPFNIENYTAEYHDQDRALDNLKTLSSDEFEGRKTGTEGNRRAMAWIEARLRESGVSPAKKDGYQAPFTAPNFDAPENVIEGTNLVAAIRGTTTPRTALLISAHYDHLGAADGIYNGADDNASGVAALLETIAWFQDNPPQNSIIFAFFDAEEQGIVGSSSMVDTLSTTEKENIAINLNLDMVARADKGELYAVGGYHFPELIPVIEDVASRAPLKLLRGHETPDLGIDDWSFASDHAPFLRSGIRILYLGVEDHADYHRPSDEFDKVNPAAFARSIDTVIMTAEALDDWVAQEQSDADQ